MNTMSLPVFRSATNINSFQRAYICKILFKMQGKHNYFKIDLLNYIDVDIHFFYFP